MPELSKRAEYQQLATALEQTRKQGFDQHWKELGDYFQPRRTRFWTGDVNRGDKRNQNIIDSTGLFAVRTLQSGLHAGLTSPARPWLRLTTPDPDLAEFAPVRRWLHTVTSRMLTVFLQSNLYNALPILYGDLGVFGTAAMGVLEDYDDLFRCYTYPVGSFSIGLDSRGICSTFYQEKQITVRQLVTTYGRQSGSTAIDWSNISRLVHDLWNKGEYQTPVEVCWLVYPNDAVDEEALGAAALPFRSVHYEKSDADQKVLRLSGFRKFPVLAPRWGVTGEDAYGTDSPGMTALGDVKALQLMQKRKAQAIEKMINPALIGPSVLRTQKVSHLPGDITYADVREGQAGLRSIHDVRLDVNHLSLDIRDTQYRIQRAFYEDLFLMLARSDNQRGAQPITAREIEERHEEKLLALGPVLERTNDELLDPLVDRVFDMMLRSELLPPPPEDLDGVELRVEYTSLMAQAQKLVGVVSLDRFMQSTGALSQLFPMMRHKIKALQVVDEYAAQYGINPNLIATDDEADASVAQEAKAQQAAIASEQMTATARATRDLAAAPLDKNSALDRVAEGLSATAAPTE